MAAKEIMSTTIDPDDILEFEHEARMLTQLNHPQVLRVFGFCTKTAEESKDNIIELMAVGSMAGYQLARRDDQNLKAIFVFIIETFNLILTNV